MTTERQAIQGEDMAKDTAQAKKLRDAMAALALTEDELAKQLGVSGTTMRSWLAPNAWSLHRKMPKTASLLLERILLDGPEGAARDKHFKQEMLARGIKIEAGIPIPPPRRRRTSPKKG